MVQQVMMLEARAAPQTVQSVLELEGVELSQ
jgi:hypothetical protein